MKNYKIIPLRSKPELKDTLAEWFSSKWSVPLEAYQNSMGECLHNQSAVPQWYAVMDGEKIIGGLGVIENDFHDSRTPKKRAESKAEERDQRQECIRKDFLP